MLELNIVEQPVSPYCSSVVLVKKAADFALISELTVIFLWLKIPKYTHLSYVTFAHPKCYFRCTDNFTEPLDDKVHAIYYISLPETKRE